MRDRGSPKPAPPHRGGHVSEEPRLKAYAINRPSPRLLGLLNNDMALADLAPRKLCQCPLRERLRRDTKVFLNVARATNSPPQYNRPL